MTQLDLTYNPPLPESRKFDGETFESAKDAERLKRQLDNVRAFMLLTGTWWSLARLSEQLRYPEASISARLRDLRKIRHGAYTVERRRVSGGIFEYRVSK